MSAAAEAAQPAVPAAEVLAAAERLAELLTAASAGLRGKPGAAAAALIGAIPAASRSYERALTRLDAATLTADLKARLRLAGERLKTLAAENERGLKAKVAAQHRLIGCVAEAVSAAAGGATYSRSGTLGTERAGRLPPPAAALSCAL